MNSVYLVAFEDGDDMCGGLHILGASTSKNVARAMLAMSRADSQWMYASPSIREVPLDKLGHLGYKMVGFEVDE